MNNKFSTEPAAKDFSRINDIIAKADGRLYMENAKAQQMANSITDLCKARRRAAAASAIGAHKIASFFYVRIGQLTSGR